MKFEYNKKMACMMPVDEDEDEKEKTEEEAAKK